MFPVGRGPFRPRPPIRRQPPVGKGGVGDPCIPLHDAADEGAAEAGDGVHVLCLLPRHVQREVLRVHHPADEPVGEDKKGRTGGMFLVRNLRVGIRLSPPQTKAAPTGAPRAQYFWRYPRVPRVSCGGSPPPVPSTAPRGDHPQHVSGGRPERAPEKPRAGIPHPGTALNGHGGK